MTSQKSEGKVVDFLKNKIFNCLPEELRMKSLRPLNSCSFSVTPEGTGLQVEQLKNYTLEWDHFQKIIEKANRLGGIMYRGDKLPQTGAKLGLEISHDCMEGFIAGELLSTSDGMTVTRRSTYYSGILAWAGIVTLHKDEGKGSFISVNQDFRSI